MARIVYELFAKYLPPSSYPVVGAACRALRYWCVRRLAVECGRRVNLEKGAQVAFGMGIRIGDYSGLGVKSHIEGPLVMGKNILMAADVVILRQNRHGYARTDISMREQRDRPPRPLAICDDVWIGRRAIILPGCGHIGKGAIIGAGAVVTKDVLEYTVVAGNPASEVKKRTLTHDPSGEDKLTLPSGIMEIGNTGL